MWQAILLQEILKQALESNPELTPEIAKKRMRASKRGIFWNMLWISTHSLIALSAPPYLILGLPMTLWHIKRISKHRKASKDEDYALGWVLYSAHRKLKAMGITLPKSVEEISSIVNRETFQFSYTTIADAKKNYSRTQERTLYLGHYRLDNTSRAIFKYLTGKTEIKPEDLPEIYIKTIDLTKSMVVLGKMGSGKSVFLKNILAQRHYRRAIINDVKGEYMESFYEEGDIIFNIYDRRSNVWDIFEDIRQNPALADVIAISTASQLSETERDFWQTAAGKLLKDALINASYEENLTTSERFQRVIDYIKDYRNKALANDDKTALSVYATLEPLLENFELLAYITRIEDVKYFSAHDFAKAEGKKLFLVNTIAHQKAQAPIFSAFISTLISILLSKPDTKEDFSLFLLDEFLNIKIPPEVLIPLFTVSRSKGIQLVFASQFLPERSHTDKRTQLILSSRHALVVFKITDENTLNAIENAYGTLEFTTTQIQDSYSMSTSHSKTTGTSRGDVEPGFLFPHIPMNYSKSRTSTYGVSSSVSTSTQRAEKKILDRSIIATLPEYHALTVIEDNSDMFLLKVEKFFYDMKTKKTEPFIQRDLTDFYRQRLSKQEQPTTGGELTWE